MIEPKFCCTIPYLSSAMDRVTSEDMATMVHKYVVQCMSTNVLWPSAVAQP